MYVTWGEAYRKESTLHPEIVGRGIGDILQLGCLKSHSGSLQIGTKAKKKKKKCPREKQEQ